jgi:hypothetical protein
LKQLASSTGDEVTVAAAKLLLQAVKGVGEGQPTCSCFHIL